MVMEQSDGEGSNCTGCIQDNLESMLFIVGSEIVLCEIALLCTCSSARVILLMWCWLACA